MKKMLCMIICLPLLMLVACDIHEFPVDRNEQVPFLLHLDFKDDMPFYKEIPYSREGNNIETKSAAAGHDVRYIIKVYRNDNKKIDSRVADTTFIFTKSNISDLNYTAQLNLAEGDYTFQAWADFVDEESTADKYYNTTDFSEIILASREKHSGSNEYRDAFRGSSSAIVTNPTYYSGNFADKIENQVTIDMVRPMGKFKFISTDVEVFLTRVIKMLKDRGQLLSVDIELYKKSALEILLQSINIGEFDVVFRYTPFMPCSFNMFTDKPADSWTGMSFTSRMYAENENEMALGFDYIFVNGNETTLGISVEVYNKYGELMSSTPPINVPIVRSKLTIVKGEFLSSIASEGVIIDPEYDGEFNVKIY